MSPAVHASAPVVTSVHIGLGDVLGLDMLQNLLVYIDLLVGAVVVRTGTNGAQTKLSGDEDHKEAQ